MVFRNETSTARNGNVWSLGNSGSRVGLAAKRAFDVIVALLGLTLFSPLLLLSSIAIAMEIFAVRFLLVSHFTAVTIESFERLRSD